MKDKYKDIKKFMEQMNLQKNYYYIILEDVGDDKFKVNAYDTTGKKYENELDHSAASVIHEGLVGLVTGKPEEVFNFGMSELAFNYSSKRMFGEIFDETGEKIEYKDNIIKVDFGSKH